ncbi:MAG TPA: glycosyltransferase family 2 protein [Ramlibacter sp.]|nr:glycosyltransferase family 2 protein [Ramlibacter sp.]
MGTAELTILMPCLNEAKTLPACIGQAFAFFARTGVSGEVLVSDNGSTDGSQRVAQSLGARVIDAPQPGYGAALIAGIAHARGKYIIMGDSDGSYDFSALDAYLAELRGGGELVMGNRFRGGIASGAMPPLHRYLGNPVLSFIGRLFFRTRIGDFHCGLRGFSREAILKLNLVSSGMEFASEMVAKAALAGLRLAEVPTTLRPDGRDRPPHLRTWRDGWRHLLFMLLFCPRWLFLFPGITLLLSGVIGFALLANGTLLFGNIGLDIHSLLYMAGAVMLGTQFIQLALLTKGVGVLSGIVPKPRWFAFAEKYLRIEAGLLIGFCLVAAGLAWSAKLVVDWGQTGYGALSPGQFMRSAIPALTLMVIGLQAAAGALFAGALLLCWNSAPRPVPQ